METGFIVVCGMEDCFDSDSRWILAKEPIFGYTNKKRHCRRGANLRQEGFARMRLFIAIPLPPDITRALSSARAALEEHGASGRFVPRENYHITLHFLGETSALHDIADAMREAARDIKPFVLRLCDYGSFKTDGSHTGFVNVRCDSDELDRLYESLEAALWERGFSKNRSKLTPHITLGRKIEGDEGFALPAQKAAFTANTLVLYESRSERGQMQYTPIHKETLL